MKRIIIFALSIIALAACTDTADVTATTADTETAVTFTFSPYEVTPITRSAVADYCTRLDIFVADPGGSVSEYHQTSTDDNFGTLAITLNNTLSYRLIAVAHRCTEPADYNHDTAVISFPEDRTTHALVYTDIITPTRNMTVNCLMQRIVALFRLETTDATPSGVTKFSFGISNVYDRWHITDGPWHAIDKTADLAVTSTTQDGTVNCNIYVIATTAETRHTITVTALSNSNAVIQSRHFPGVPLRNGYKTTYRGPFFIDAPMTATFTAADWLSYDTVSF